MLKQFLIPLNKASSILNWFQTIILSFKHINNEKPHSAFRIPHSAFRIPHSAFRIPHSAFRIPLITKSFFLMLALAIVSPAAYSQSGECGLEVTVRDFQASLEDLQTFAPVPPSSIPATVPVIFYVALQDNGSPSNALTEANADAALALLNQEFSSNPNYTFNFVRCGKINYVRNTSLYNGTPLLHSYAYSPWAVNVYVDNSGSDPSADFPWIPGNVNNNIYMRSHGYDLLLWWRSFAHEMGHSFGLHHTFGAISPYVSPPVTGQIDHPYNPEPTAFPRELVIRGFDNTKPYGTPNHGGPPVDGQNDVKAADLLKDTPAGCRPNAPGAFPGCSFNSSTCSFNESTYVDYNGMLIDDPSNVLGKNFMSYGNGNCREEFTSEQLGRVYTYYVNQRQGQYKPDWCGNMDDKVEFEGSDKGQNRVFIQFLQSSGGGFYPWDTKTLTNHLGEFNGILQPNLPFTSFAVTASVKKLGSNPDFTFTLGNWKDGVTTYDAVLIQKHVLGLAYLNGYRQLAADVNKTGSVTTYDAVLVRNLVLQGTLGDNPIPFPPFTQPWRFIRESATLNNPDEFDGLLNSIGQPDNPFQIPNLDGDTPYTMTSGKQGFDAVKLGDVNGSNSESDINGESNGGTLTVEPIYVDIVKQVNNGVSTYEFKVQNFQNIIAYQMDIEFPEEVIQFAGTQSMALAGVNPDFFGTTHAAEGLVKTLWYDEVNANTATLPNGSGIFKLVFNGTANQLGNDVHLSNNIGYRSNSEVSLNNFAYLEDGTVVPIVQREYLLGDVLAVSANPNPFTDAIRLDVEAVRDGIMELALYNTVGQRLYQGKHAITKGSNAVEIGNLTHLPPSVYFVQLKNGADTIVKKVVKKD